MNIDFWVRINAATTVDELLAINKELQDISVEQYTNSVTYYNTARKLLEAKTDELIAEKANNALNEIANSDSFKELKKPTKAMPTKKKDGGKKK